MYAADADELSRLVDNLLRIRMIRIIAIGIVTALTVADAHVLTFTTQPDKN